MSERRRGRVPARRGSGAFRAAVAGAIVAAGLAVGAQAQPQAGHSPYFLDAAPWTVDITNAPVDAQSPAIISWLATPVQKPDLTMDEGIWTNSSNNPPGRIQIDFALEVLEADATATFRSFTKTADWFNGDCDFVQVPIPPGGAIEDELGYECTQDGDCHLLVVDRSKDKLYEMWRANIDNTNTFYGGCLAVWDLRTSYQPSGRGLDCSSADAAGFPIAPLLVNADEVAADTIHHALRYVLPNYRIRAQVYVAPATHSTDPTSGPSTAPPYGARLRLRGDYPLQNLPNENARRIARAMQKYGILLSDGGNIALTMQSDRFTTASWSGLGIDSHSLSKILITDFQMIEGGTRHTYTGDCARTFPLFGDGFEAGLTPKWNAKTP
jgi:hypothetical protein